jgi:hypothetical protein
LSVTETNGQAATPEFTYCLKDLDGPHFRALVLDVFKPLLLEEMGPLFEFGHYIAHKGVLLVSIPAQ